MSYSNIDKEVEKIELFFDEVIAKYKSVYKAAVREVGAQIVDNTPLFIESSPTRGHVKANWNISEGNADFSTYPQRTDVSGNETKRKIGSFVKSVKVKNDTVIHISNGLEEAKMLEYGLYPNPPRMGTWNPATHSYEKRSEGGFSKQAPSGMVGVVAMQWEDIVASKRKDKPSLDDI